MFTSETSILSLPILILREPSPRELESLFGLKIWEKDDKVGAHERSATRGTPQGGALSPILLLLVWTQGGVLSPILLLLVVDVLLG